MYLVNFPWKEQINHVIGDILDLDQIELSSQPQVLERNVAGSFQVVSEGFPADQHQRYLSRLIAFYEPVCLVEDIIVVRPA